MKASRLLTSLHLIGFRAEVEAAMRLRLQRIAVPEIARRAGFASPLCASGTVARRHLPSPHSRLSLPCGPEPVFREIISVLLRAALRRRGRGDRLRR
jgi:hypothetical protein